MTAYSFPKEIVKVIIMLYNDTEAMVRSFDFVNLAKRYIGKITYSEH